MTDLEIPADAGGQIISYGITAEDIEAMKQRYAVVRFDTPAEYKAGVAAIAEIRNTRTAIERRRTDLKRIHLETGRKIDAEAARWTALLEQVEAPLKEAKKAIDDEKARKKAEEEAAKAKAIQDKIDAANAARQAELDRQAEENRIMQEKLAAAQKRLEEQQAAAKAKADEEARIAREQEEKARREREAAEAKEREERRQREEAAAKAERDRLAKIEAEQRAERERLAEERRKIEAEAARIKAEQDAKELAERLAREAEERRIAELERAAEIAARLEKLKPDAAKLKDFAKVINAVWGKAPLCESNEARDTINAVGKKLDEAVLMLNEFGEFTKEGKVSS